MEVALFFLSDVKYGGFVSYTVHLRRALEASGIRCRVFKIRNRTERKARWFCKPHYYQNLDIGTAVAALRNLKGLIVCCNWKKEGHHAAPLLEQGVPIVIHDPTEMQPGLMACIRDNGNMVIVIRKRNRVTLDRKHGIEAQFIRHPYVRATRTKPSKKRGHAASISRVDFDKHTDMIVHANNLLPSNRQIRVYGFVNRIYDFHKLTKLDDDWRRNYHGTFELTEDAGVSMARDHRYIVDMSAIKGDGGGTQYTFLEAWDGGSVLVLNKEWLTKRNNVIVPGENALIVESAEELASVIRIKNHPARDTIRRNGREILRDHAPARIVRAYKRILKG